MKACPHCHSEYFKYHGWFERLHTRSKVRRYKCNDCRKTFSSRTLAADRYQKKCKLNRMIAGLLCNRGTLRGIARSLDISYATAYRKFLWLGEMNKEVICNKPGRRLWFDEMETFEHTKLKPLVIALAVDENYQVHQAQVGTQPAKGHIAQIAQRKYGPRANESIKVCQKALATIASYSKPEEIYTDCKPTYGKIIKGVFKECQHIQIKSQQAQSIAERYGCKKFDHLFPVNQRSANLREKISRLTRKSWITTKKAKNLQMHLNIFMAMQNGTLIS